MKEEDLGEVDLDEEVKERAPKLYIPNWFSVEVKTGVGGGRGMKGGGVKHVNTFSRFPLFHMCVHVCALQYKYKKICIFWRDLIHHFLSQYFPLSPFSGRC